MEQQWCGKTQILFCPQNIQSLDQYLMKTGHLDKIMCIRAAEKY